MYNVGFFRGKILPLRFADGFLDIKLDDEKLLIEDRDENLYEIVLPAEIVRPQPPENLHRLSKLMSLYGEFDNVYVVMTLADISLILQADETRKQLLLSVCSHDAIDYDISFPVERVEINSVDDTQNSFRLFN